MQQTNKKPELLAPAGDFERLRMAVAYGADAVYLAGSDFGMRAFAGNFSPEEMEQAVALCRAKGVDVHVTCNTMARNQEMDRLPAFMELLESLRVDAVIAADLGVLRTAQKYAPHVKIHMSTQAGVTNYHSASMWHELGASRVILARELSLDEVRELRSRTPKELEVETFVHGAMCVSYSGRCVLSNYMTGRDAQRGACAQPCRYKYALMEEKRPGEYFPVEEDSKGAYIFSSRDMCMIDHVGELIDAGVDSLKVEGRAKSAYYAACVTNAYRHAIDAAVAGQPLNPIWRDEVEKVSHRHYSTGFFYGQPGEYTEDGRYIRQWQVIAQVEQCDADGNAVLSLRNKFAKGDRVELVAPGLEPAAFEVPMMEDMERLPLEEPRNPQMLFRMKLPMAVQPLALLRIQRDNS